MKEKTFSLVLAVIAIISLAACGNPGDGGTKEELDKSSGTSQQIPDLSGEWKQTNSNSDTTYQTIYISNDTMEVYWIMEENDTVALYWAGTFQAPKTTDEPYHWDSQNDHSRTSGALLASDDETKTFTYEDGKLSYSVSAFGRTMTAEATKQEWGYSEMIESHSENNSSVNLSVGSGDLGDYHVEIKGATLAKDYSGKPAIIVTYAWTNNSNDTTSAMVSVSGKAFQDGVQLETALIMGDDSYDAGASMKDVRPGTTIDVQSAYILTSETAVVEFELTDWISFSDDMVTMDFDPAALT